MATAREMETTKEKVSIKVIMDMDTQGTAKTIRIKAAANIRLIKAKAARAAILIELLERQFTL